jgi:sterol desaturase/sphingolipid hydroxylase (fatty acid hydroxylase superfamily)
LKLWPKVPNAARQSIGIILIATLLPFAARVLTSGAERLFEPAGPRKSFKAWLLHLQMGFFWSFIFGFTSAFAAMGANALAGHLGFEFGLIDLRFAEGKGIPALIVATWISIVVADFFFYWYHRAAHKVPFLWQLHKLHHMDRELDAMTLNRDNWIDAVYAAITISIPMGLFVKLDDLDLWKLGLLSGFIVFVIQTLLALGHMNVKCQVGKASLLFCSPQVHRIHHSCLSQHFDKNFAFAFPFWDFIFGTYYAPAHDEFPPSGVPGEEEVGSFWEAQIFTLREWRTMYMAWREKSQPKL